MTPSISVVVPVYNSSATLQELVSRVRAAMERIPVTFEIILVNDGSADDSWSKITDLAVEYDNLRGVDLMRNFGQHNAVLAGVRAAVGEVVVTLDDDLQHPPESIPALIRALTPEVDLVYGTPVRQQHSWWRNVASVGSKSLMSWLCGWGQAGRITDFRAFRTVLRLGFAGYNAPDVTFDALLASTTTSIAQVPVEHAQREVGHSNYRLATLARYGVTMATGYSVRPLRLIVLLGGLILAGGVVSVGGVLIADAAAGHRLLTPGLAVALSVLFGGLELSAIGVVGEYVGRGHVQMLAKPTYLVRGVVGAHPDNSDPTGS